MLPEDVAREVRDRKAVLNSTDRIVDYLSGELARYNDKQLSTLHDQQDRQRVDGAPKNAVNAIVEAERRVTDLVSKFESTVAAFQSRTPSAPTGAGGGGGGAGAAPRSQLPKPDSNFKGCWHCGKNHKGGRRQCPEFRALLKREQREIAGQIRGRL